MTNQRDELLAQVAYWYYVNGEGLSAISKRFGRSVSMASRMLQEARDKELVEIRINYPLSTSAELETEIEVRFGIRKAYVFAEMNALAGVDSLDRFGALGASVLQDEFTNASVIGASWGSHVYSIVKGLPSTLPNRGGLVVQTSGALGATDPEHDGARISQKLAERMGYNSRLLYAPLVVDTPHVAEALRESPTIAEVLQASRNADVVLISVGTPFGDTSGLRRAGYLSSDDLKSLRDENAVGDIMGYHLNKDGDVLNIDLNKRVVGLEPAALSAIGNVVVAATGIKKVAAILAALQGGYINTLLTDKVTAEALLKN